MATIEEEFQKHRASGKRPIAGQSLANDPENPAPYEKPPRFTSVHEASEYLWESFIEPEIYKNLMESVSQGVPIMNIVQAVLFTEFQQGAWNPDLMMMLFEPATYMIMALAERQDLDMVIYQGEEDDEMDEELTLGTILTDAKLKRLKKAKASGTVPSGMFSAEIQKSLESLPEEPEQQEEEAQPNSLMARPTGV